MKDKLNFLRWSIFLFVCYATPALAQVDPNELATLGPQLGLGGNTDLKLMLINLIRFALGFLGLFAVIIVLYGGFQWMVSGGNEERVAGARATLTSGFIGLIIILFAYAIVSYVVGTVTTELTV